LSLPSIPPRARRAVLSRFLEAVDPTKEGFDFRELVETFAQTLDPPMQGVSFLRLVLEELEDRAWAVPQPLVDRLFTSLPAQLRDHMSDALVFARVPQGKWRLFRPADWVFERAIVDGAAKTKHLTILHVDVERGSAPFGTEKLHLILEADDLTWVERRFRTLHRKVNYDDDDEQRRLLTNLFGPSILEPLMEDHLRQWFYRDRRVARVSVRLERWPESFAYLARPSFEVSINVVFDPLTVDQQGLVRRLKEVLGKVL
jgi:hypothetical protein